MNVADDTIALAPGAFSGSLFGLIEILSVHQAFGHELTHIIDQIIDIIRLGLMIDLAVLIHVVAIADTPAQASHIPIQRVKGAAPEFGSQRYNVLSVVILKAMLLDLYQQIIEFLGSPDALGINLEFVHNSLLDIRSAQILFIGIVNHGPIHLIHVQVKQVHAVQILTEHDVLIRVLGKISIFIILGIYLRILHVLGHVRKHFIRLCRFQQNRELRPGGIVQIADHGVHAVVKPCVQLGGQRIQAAVLTGCVLQFQRNASTLFDLLENRCILLILRKRITGIAYKDLYNDIPVCDPLVTVSLIASLIVRFLIVLSRIGCFRFLVGLRLLCAVLRGLILIAATCKQTRNHGSYQQRRQHTF